MIGWEFGIIVKLYEDGSADIVTCATKEEDTATPCWEERGDIQHLDLDVIAYWDVYAK